MFLNCYISARFKLFEKIIDLGYDNFKYTFIPRLDRITTEHQKAKQNLSDNNVLFRNLQSLFIFPLMYGLLAIESFTICTLSFVFSFIIFNSILELYAMFAMKYPGSRTV